MPIEFSICPDFHSREAIHETQYVNILGHLNPNRTIWMYEWSWISESRQESPSIR